MLYYLEIIKNITVTFNQPHYEGLMENNQTQVVFYFSKCLRSLAKMYGLNWNYNGLKN